jgi:hypothetical protein
LAGIAILMADAGNVTMPSPMSKGVAGRGRGTGGGTGGGFMPCAKTLALPWRSAVSDVH